MSEPTPPDGHRPAEPPKIPEQNGGQAVSDDSDDETPQRAERPAFDSATVEHPTLPGGVPNVPPGKAPPPPPPPHGGPPVAPAVASGMAAPAFGQTPPSAGPVGPPPPGPYQPGPPPAGAPPPGPYKPVPGPPPPQPGPGGPNYGGPPTGPGGPQFGGPGDPGGEPPKKRGLLIAGLVAVVIALVGALGFVLAQGGGNEDADDLATTQDEVEPATTGPAVTEPVVTEVLPETTAVAETTTTSAAALTGSVEGLFTHIEARGEIIPDDQLATSLEQLGLAEGDNPVSTADAVLNLCAAIPVDAPVGARVSWSRDNVSVLDGTSRTFSSPADGNCINNNGEPLADGAYEVFFTDDADGESGVALFTVGAATRSQEFVNDSAIELCSVDLGPTTSGFYQSFELTSEEPIVIGESIIIDVADVEHEARGVDCSEATQESIFFLPSDDPVGLVSGISVPATTDSPAFLSDDELRSIDGEVGSLDTAIEPGSAAEAAVFDVLLNPEGSFRLASTDPSLTLCGAWNVPGPLEADVVWEFNRSEIARFPVTAVGGSIGLCVPPGDASFGEGAYQVYLQRGDVVSAVETFTVGREETLLAFTNDTSSAICEVGFSPNLTNWYSFFVFAESSAFEGALEPGEAFTIAAPFIENDIQARDCDGEVVSEVFDIAPTDQTLSVSTGI
jgi:hypothetical protein